MGVCTWHSGAQRTTCRSRLWVLVGPRVSNSGLWSWRKSPSSNEPSLLDNIDSFNVVSCSSPVVGHYPWSRTTSIFIRAGVRAGQRSSQLGLLTVGSHSLTEGGRWASHWTLICASHSSYPAYGNVDDPKAAALHSAWMTASLLPHRWIPFSSSLPSLYSGPSQSP